MCGAEVRQGETRGKPRILEMEEARTLRPPPRTRPSRCFRYLPRRPCTSMVLPLRTIRNWMSSVAE
jgi:hypothetical protein